MAVSTVMRSTLAVAVARSLGVAPARRYPSASSSHIPLAHALWADVLRPGDTAVDCTCGNGADSAVLAARVFEGGDGRGAVLCVDVQARAIAATAARLAEQFAPAPLPRGVRLRLGSHVGFDELAPRSARLFVWNLGYLPGLDRDRGVTTLAEGTVASLRAAAPRLAAGGLLSVTCYPGHAEGAREAAAVRAELATWPASEWVVFEHAQLTLARAGKAAPTLITAYRRDQPHVRRADAAEAAARSKARLEL